MAAEDGLRKSREKRALLQEGTRMSSGRYPVRLGSNCPETAQFPANSSNLSIKTRKSKPARGLGDKSEAVCAESAEVWGVKGKPQGISGLGDKAGSGPAWGTYRPVQGPSLKGHRRGVWGVKANSSHPQASTQTPGAVIKQATSHGLSARHREEHSRGALHGQGWRPSGREEV